MTKNDILEFLSNVKDTMAANRDYLIKLDSVFGDGDLGLTMGDGFAAAYESVKDTEEEDVGKIMYIAGKSMGNAVPSTMGTLMAAGLLQAGKALKGKEKLTETDVITLFEAYEEGVQKLGKANPGEKTFLDGIHPAVIMLKESLQHGDTLKEAADKAAKAAADGFGKTITMKAVHGRAAVRGEASREFADPGAAVAMLLMQAFADSISGSRI